eukprot:s5490_g1.t1
MCSGPGTSLPQAFRKTPEISALPATPGTQREGQPELRQCHQEKKVVTAFEGSRSKLKAFTHQECPEPELNSARATQAAWRWPGDASAITMQDIWYSEPAAGYKRLRTTPAAWVPRLSSRVDPSHSDGPRPPSTPPPSSKLQPGPKNEVWPVRSWQVRRSTSRVSAPRAAKALPTAAPDLVQNLQKKPESRPAPSYVPARPQPKPKYAPSAVPPAKAFEPEVQEDADESAWA